ncbi:MAG: nicotinate (nicotinamide) nucleotide adenylyltransferase [Cyclobacteriaceae bacterium]
MKIGLFFGSFNPIHMGHLIVAQAVRELSDLDEIWFVISPQNPFKKNKKLLHEFDRLDMVRAAIDDNYSFRACDIEFSMPKPSYTIDTLVYLSEKHPNHSFKLLIGGDNLTNFHKWKNYQQILDDYGLIVYPRPNSGVPPVDFENTEMISAPEINISATMIRKMIKEGMSPRYLLPDEVLELIKAKKFYLD